ncbi:hypothetical protein SCWH03_00120 [Streptomyces pacificus]|uniref:Uncharacterized protein n=1 Tax=Streptomyces pacificus TaxID=2705029 RepID=A0A6A0ANG2_9ACTN|nr:hypothetical protein SCWH03_00120 [Streptomyces pacificus]
MAVLRSGVPEAIQIFDIDGVAILPMGEEEVKVAKSEAPVLIGAWCKREMLRK